MSAGARAFNLQGPPHVQTTQSGAVHIAVPESYSLIKVVTEVAQNVDRFDAHWVEGREIAIFVDPQSANSLTFRDVDLVSTSELRLASSALSIVLGPGDIVRFRARYDASGNEAWYQDSAVMNH